MILIITVNTTTVPLEETNCGSKKWIGRRSYVMHGVLASCLYWEWGYRGTTGGRIQVNRNWEEKLYQGGGIDGEGGIWETLFSVKQNGEECAGGGSVLEYSIPPIQRGIREMELRLSGRLMVMKDYRFETNFVC